MKLFLLLTLFLVSLAQAELSPIGVNATYLQGTAVSPSAPSNADCLKYNSGTGQWAPAVCSTAITGAQNLVYATPNGSSGAATLRALVNADLPFTIGTGPNNVVALDGSSKLPAIDGSQLTNLPSSGAPTNNPTFTGLVTVPNGTITGLTGNTPGVAFTGAATTGFAYVDVAGVQSVDILMGGRQLLSINNASGVYSAAFLVDSIYCDPTGGPCTLGTPVRNFTTLYNRFTLAGGKTDGTGFSGERGVWYQVGGWGGGANVVGMGLDGLNGNEFYLSFYEPTTVAYTTPFNVKADNRITTLSAPDDAANNATAAHGMVLKSANKVAGTGNSSPTVIDTGTSTGGTVGPIDFKIGGTAKYQITSGGTLKNVAAGNEATGAGTALLGSNCPAVTVTAPYTWVKMVSSDGSTVYVPAYK